METPKEVIFVSLEPWDTHWRRNQFICDELARRDLSRKILFVAPPRDVSNRIRTGRFPFSFDSSVTFNAPDFKNITVTRPLKLLPNSIALGRVVNDWLFRRHVRRVARQLNMQSPLLWLNPHDAVHMIGRMGESASIYDITDDWTTLTQSRGRADLIRRQDALLCEEADATIICSERLYEMKKDLARQLHLVSNGVDAKHYGRVLDGTASLPPEISQWRKPVLGYTGTVHPDRVDVELVAKIAISHSGSVVLIGPNHLSRSQIENLRRLENVIFLGTVPYTHIPDYMAAFDVCITPHKMTPFTESLNPIKLWEYLAAGLPIVSTDVAGFRDYPDLVHLARTPEEFIAATKVALAEGKSKAHLRQQEAAKHSWSSRVDQIEAVIASCLERRRNPSAKMIAPTPGGEVAHAP